MPPIINAQQVSKTYGSSPLFKDISFQVSEGDRIGLIGPNGAGKSTLLQILGGRVQPDTGEVAVRKRTRFAYVAQVSEFKPGETVRSVMDDAMEEASVPEADRPGALAATLGRAGFEDFDVEAASLSGGWRKRLAIAAGLARQPDVMFLDEPTNHLDISGIHWLEEVLQTASFAFVVVSHDRYLLERAATELVELRRIYENGLLRVKGAYSAFLETRAAFLVAEDSRRESLANRVRSEIEWLRRGAKARTSKAKARIDNAQAMMGELADLESRNRTATAAIEFSATDRRTKQLIELDGVECAIAGRTLFAGLDLLIKPGMRLGLVGPNGSGKTTLLRLMRGDISPVKGAVRRADRLRIVYFDQNRELDPSVTLKRALAPDSDSVVYQDRVIHVASWASRFLFSSETLNQPVGRLSGGERARVLIAQLMLQPADVLLLDEPTNDLDIPTLEVLEESLMEFPGALVLVTHDRYLLDRVSTHVLGLDGLGHAERFAEFSQWEPWVETQEAKAAGATPVPANAATQSAPAAPARRKLSYMEAREYAAIEERIAVAEESLRAKQAAIADPAIVSDAARLVSLSAEIEEAQNLVDQLYARWSELEEKQAPSSL
ncbi:MAG TPA: ABC-F family ATP-binding cassette domain-containing protein [Terriglobia bacterium]|nr:ABC-F family ATP-binding cassette domain-containing protein [Terriglobia bacterium]